MGRRSTSRSAGWPSTRRRHRVRERPTTLEHLLARRRRIVRCLKIEGIEIKKHGDAHDPRQLRVPLEEHARLGQPASDRPRRLFRAGFNFRSTTEIKLDDFDTDLARATPRATGAACRRRSGQAPGRVQGPLGHRPTRQPRPRPGVRRREDDRDRRLRLRRRRPTACRTSRSGSSRPSRRERRSLRPVRPTARTTTSRRTRPAPTASTSSGRRTSTTPTSADAARTPSPTATSTTSPCATSRPG